MGTVAMGARSVEAVSRRPIAATLARPIHSARAFVAIARAELCGVQPILTGTTLLAIAATFLLRWRCHVLVEPLSLDGLLLVFELAAVASVPSATEIFGSGRRKALAGLPVQPSTLGLAQLVAVLTATGFAFCLLIPLDAFAHEVMASHGPRPGRGLQLGAPMVREVGVMVSLGLAAAILLASVLHHSVGAVLGACGLVGWMVAADAMNDGYRRSWISELGGALFAYPGFASIAVLVCLVAMLCLGIQTPRGAASRRAWRRLSRIAAIPTVLALVASIPATSGYAQECISRAASPARIWDDPGAKVWGYKASPDGRWVALVLRHEGLGAPRKATWIVDALDGSVRRADDGVGYLQWVGKGRDGSSAFVHWSQDNNWLLLNEALVDPANGERVHPLQGDASDALRVSNWDYLDREFFEDDSKRMTVRYGDGPECSYHCRRGFGWPRSQPFRLFYGDPSGEIRVLDGRTGEDRATGVRWSNWDTFSVADHGRALWVTRRPTWKGPKGSWIVDLETLEQVPFEPSVTRHGQPSLVWVEGPALALRWDEESAQWRNLFGPEQGKPWGLPRSITGQLALGRWLSVTDQGAVRLHQSDGAVWKTLRGKEPESGNQ